MNIRVVSQLDEGYARFDVRHERVMDALAHAEDRHFWHASRNRFIADRVRALAPDARTLLELGCGGGCVSAHLARAGYDVVGVDGHISLVKRAASRAPSARFVVHDLSRGIEELGEDARDRDVVALFDVIEHLDDPRGALEGALRACRPGGLVVGTVPALDALWSVVDVIAGHRLRYSFDALSKLCRDVPGARVREVRHFNRALVPLMWLQRRRMKGEQAAVSEDNLEVPRTPLNEALYYLVRAEHRAAPLLDRTPIPGASLWFALDRTG